LRGFSTRAQHLVCVTGTLLQLHRLQWRREREAKGVSALGGTVQGAAFGGAKIWNSEILHPQLSVLFTVHTNAIVVTMRISIRDLIAGVGVATKTFTPGGKHPRAATVPG